MWKAFPTSTPGEEEWSPSNPGIFAPCVKGVYDTRKSMGL